jgi:hypothetical protein
MRISIFARVEGDDTGSCRKVPIGAVERGAALDPASGMGLWIQEAHELLEQIQAVLLVEQAEQFIRAAARCLACYKPLSIKDSKSVVYRTAFGKMAVRSPRFYSCCSTCGFHSGEHVTVSPLAKALRERVHPQWAWLQCRYASTMSYRLAQTLLRDAFPGGKTLPSSSIKLKVRAVGERLEHEAALATAVVAEEQAAATERPRTGPQLALQIDAGYIRTSRKAEPGAWMPVVVSKLVPPGRHRSFAHAYVPSLVAQQGARQQAFLRSLQVPASATVTVLSDGGDDISLACKLPCARARVLDWFHIGMYFERLLKALPGLKGADTLTREDLRRKIVAAKRQLWYGRRHECLAALESLRRDTGWVGARNPLGCLIRYLRTCTPLLVNYAARRRMGQPISSAGAESAVDFVVGQRMKRNGHMRWTPAGANAILQVRCSVLNGQDVRNFKRWYPPGARIATLPEAVAAP